MKTDHSGNMINEGTTFVYANWLAPLLKFDWQRVYDISETFPFNLSGNPATC